MNVLTYWQWNWANSGITCGFMNSAKLLQERCLGRFESETHQTPHHLHLSVPEISKFKRRRLDRQSTMHFSESLRAWTDRPRRVNISQYHGKGKDRRTHRKGSVSPTRLIGPREISWEVLRTHEDPLYQTVGASHFSTHVASLIISVRTLTLIDFGLLPFAQFKSRHYNVHHLRQEEGTLVQEMRVGWHQRSSPANKLPASTASSRQNRNRQISNDQRNMKTMRQTLQTKRNVSPCVSNVSQRCLQHTADEMEPLFRCNRPGVARAFSNGFQGHGDGKGRNGILRKNTLQNKQSVPRV